MEDFSKVFTVEIYGSKGWEVINYFTCWKDASGIAEAYTHEFQVRITSPRKENEKIVEKIQEIHEKNIDDSPERFGKRIVAAVVAGI